jgi:tetratricopeptide (TPR) repeat protein
MGDNCWVLGRADSALAYYSQAIRLSRATGDRAGEAIALSGAAHVYGQLVRADSALAFFREALPIQREIGDRRGEGATLDGIGLHYLRHTDPDHREPARAAAYFDSAAATIADIRRHAGGDANSAVDTRWQPPSVAGHRRCST